jgi:ATP:cob(I)alamin adenosyltransferase
MKVYTKTGDDGQTSLLSKQRVFKDHIRVQAYGTVDEANCAMGLAKSLLGEKMWAQEIIQTIQQQLINLNADLATVGENGSVQYRITSGHVEQLENQIDRLEQRRIPQHYFVTPGDTSASAALDLSRTVVRRAERYVVRLSRTEEVPRSVALYLNRLSDLLFVLARCVEQDDLIKTVTGTVVQTLQSAGEGGGKLVMTLLNKAKQIIAAAEQKAMEINVPMVIAVVDDGGNLVAQQRMDGALLASIQLAFDKAYTAVALRMATEEAAWKVVPGQSLYGLNTANGGRYIVFGGGIPFYDSGNLAGAIGVSGGAVEEDILVANAGLAKYQLG